MLAEVVDHLAQRGRAAVLLRGPAGIGKSRLADEAARRLPRRLRVVRVQATPALAEIPLGAFADLLGRPDVASETVGAAPAGEVDLSLLDGPQLLGRVRRLLQVPHGERQLVLLVDDVGQLDALSLSVVVALLQARAAILLATSRDDGPVPDGLSVMWSSGDVAQVQVLPLDADACHHLVEETLGGPVGAQAGAVLYRSSGGNPLYLRELVAETQRQGGFSQVQGVWRLTGAVVGSPALVELIQRRLAALSADHRDVLDRIALCQPLDVDEVVTAAGVAVEVVAALEQDGLVVVEGGFLEGLRVRIAHPQYESVIRSSVSRLRANRLIAAQLDAVSTNTPRSADDVRTALWSLTALGNADPELLLRAARLARLGHDFAAVRRLCTAAFQSAPEPRGEESWSGLAELRLLAGEAERELGSPARAAQLLVLAAALPATPEIAARVAVGRAMLEVDEGAHRLDAALVLLHDALERFPDQAPTLLGARARLLAPTNAVGEGLRALEAASLDGRRDAWSAVGAQLLANAGRVEEALTWSAPDLDRAPSTAGAAADTPLLRLSTDLHVNSTSAPLHPTEAALGRAWALLAGGRYDDAIAASRRALTLAVGDGLDHTVTTAEWQLAAALLHAGLPRTAARWCADVISG